MYKQARQVKWGIHAIGSSFERASVRSDCMVVERVSRPVEPSRRLLSGPHFAKTRPFALGEETGQATLSLPPFLSASRGRSYVGEIQCPPGGLRHRRRMCRRSGLRKEAISDARQFRFSAMLETSFALPFPFFSPAGGTFSAGAVSRRIGAGRSGAGSQNGNNCRLRCARQV